MNDRIPMLEIPLFPFTRETDKTAAPPRRLRPTDALDLPELVREMERSAVCRLPACNGAWAVVSVFSPYSPDMHVMALELSPDRYLPGPERVPDEEGDALAASLAAILVFIENRYGTDAACWGYNWSPRSWGAPEEHTGFQSVPTKWHPQIWAAPPCPGAPYARWATPELLSDSERRLLLDNDHGRLFGETIRGQLERRFGPDSLFRRMFPADGHRCDARGFATGSALAPAALLARPGFFSQALKPVANALDELLRDVTETMTTLDCAGTDRLLTGIEQGTLPDLTLLRAAPALRDPAAIRRAFAVKGYPDGLADALHEPVRLRCEERGDAAEWWRKGFGYALALRGRKDGGTELRIMPGLRNGPGGVVEALGMVLRRPEDRMLDSPARDRKRAVLRELEEYLLQRKKGNDA